MRCNFSPAVCHINLDALRRNYRRLAEKRHLMPVIKADAYGHGLLETAKTLDGEGARFFAVGGVTEGVALRQNGLDQEVLLLLGCPQIDDWRAAARHNLLPIAGSREDLLLARQIAGENPDKPARIAIKCDTGMSRLGFASGDMAELIDFLSSTTNIQPVLLLSHLACADMPEEREFTTWQIKLFTDVRDTLKSHFPDILSSLGNSAATLAAAADAFDISRPGLALYGGNPFAGTALAHYGEDLEWVMSFAAPVLHVRDLKVGQSISYGRTFTASRPMRIAVIACGYANGIARNLSGRMDFIINGRRAPQIGRICMGMMMLDVTSMGDVQRGDEAWLLNCPDKKGERPLDAQVLATRLNTIPYEILCLLGTVNPRKYHSLP